MFKPKVRPAPAIGEDHQDDPDLTLYMVNVEVIKAQGLHNADGGLGRKLVRRGDVSDPYCVVTLGGMCSRTHTVEDNLNPEWNERLTFFVARECATALLQVFDEDTHSADDLCGAAEFDFGSLFEDEGTRDAVLPLSMENGRWKGSLTVRVSCSLVSRSSPPTDADEGERSEELQRAKEDCKRFRRAAKGLKAERKRLREQLRAAEARRDELEAEAARDPAEVVGMSLAARRAEAVNELTQRHARQFQMLKVGVPEGAVVATLVDEGLGEKEAREVVAGLVAAMSAEEVSDAMSGEAASPPPFVDNGLRSPAL